MNRIKLERFRRGLTMREVQAETGVSYPTLKALEEADRPEPTAPIALALASFYEVPVEDLLGLDEREAA